MRRRLGIAPPLSSEQLCERAPGVYIAAHDGKQGGQGVPTVNSKSTQVPKLWQDRYNSLVSASDAFCRQHLDAEYAELARGVIAALCRKRPSPMASGKPETWICAVLYALGQINFLTDKSSRPYMAMADLCAHFGVGASTAGNKAKLVREALGMNRFGHRWMLPSLIARMPHVWLIECNGRLVDARDLPVEVQAMAVERGLIPYVNCRVPAAATVATVSGPASRD